MKFVSLISGGKDSVFALHQASEWGHTPIALAHLIPQDEDVEELDSWTFQTVGHHAVKAMASCIGLPLYIRHITGSSLFKDLQYQTTKDDEIEDLYALLSYVKQQHPDLQAVVSGAILSHYQRTRVEHVCRRLGLVSLAPLWRMDQVTLLESMSAANHHSILIKVASMGLKPQMLGKRLADVHEELLELRDTCGLNPAGEGGEFETLTVASPAFTNGELTIGETRVEVVTEDDWAPVAHMVVTDCRCELHSDGVETSVTLVPDNYTPTPEVAPTGDAPDSATTDIDIDIDITRGHGWLRVRGTGLSLASVTEAVMHAAETSSSSWDWNGVFYTEINVSDMSQFGQLNAVYGSRFPGSAPARSCLQLINTPDSGLFTVDMVFWTANGMEIKKRVRIGSISPWAPACVGPYSQGAHTEAGPLFLAGSIPIDPVALSLTPSCTPAMAWRHALAISRDEFGVGADRLSGALLWDAGACVAAPGDAACPSLRVQCAALPLGCPFELTPGFIGSGHELHRCSLGPWSLSTGPWGLIGGCECTGESLDAALSAISTRIDAIGQDSSSLSFVKLDVFVESSQFDAVTARVSSHAQCGQWAVVREAAEVGVVSASQVGLWVTCLV